MTPPKMSMLTLSRTSTPPSSEIWDHKVNRSEDILANFSKMSSVLIKNLEAIDTVALEDSEEEVLFINTMDAMEENITKKDNCNHGN